MTKKPRIPEIDQTDVELQKLARQIRVVAARHCSDPSDFWACSRAAFAAAANGLWLDEQWRLNEAVTDEETVTVDGQAFRRLSQPSSVLLHGLWGAHRVREPLYRLIGVHNGPTLKPLVAKVGVVDGSLLPDLADAAGELLAIDTSRTGESLLTRLGFRPPSRATLQKRIGGLYSDMEICARDLDEQVRSTDALDFELASISCGLDRFAVRMDEDLPDGPQRDAKLSAQSKRKYRRTPPEPRNTAWRMAWAANVTLYDGEGVALQTVRYGTDQADDYHVLIARMVDEVLHHVRNRTDVLVTVIQDGAPELTALATALEDRLPDDVQLRKLIDFHHAIGYLDCIVAARDDGDPCNMRAAYRGWLLAHDDGAIRIVKHLRREAAKPDNSEPVARALSAAETYFAKRRPLMRYSAARQAGRPIGSGATESTCGLHQLRVKHPGSHWRVPGLRGVLNARALQVSGRFGAAFRAHQASLRREIQTSRSC